MNKKTMETVPSGLGLVLKSKNDRLDEKQKIQTFLTRRYFDSIWFFQKPTPERITLLDSMYFSVLQFQSLEFACEFEKLH